MKKQALVAVIVLAVLAGVLFWALSSPSTDPKMSKTQTDSTNATKPEEKEKTPPPTETNPPTEATTKTDTPEAISQRTLAKDSYPFHLTGKVMMKNGEAIPENTTVKAEFWTEKQKQQQSFTAQAAKDGSFSIGVPLIPPYAVLSAESDFAYSKSVQVKAKKDGTFPEVKISLQLGGKIEGQVFLPDETPAKQAKLALFLTDSEWDFPIKKVESDEKGFFAIRGVPAGRGRRVRATLKDFSSGYAKSIETKLTSVSKVELHLTPESAFIGKVVSEENVPVEGVAVRAQIYGDADSFMEVNFREQDYANAVSASDGSFKIGSLSPGKYSLTAQKSGFESSESKEAITLAIGEKKNEIVLTLKNGEVISGKILDAQGLAVSDATVVAHPSKDEMIYTQYMAHHQNQLTAKSGGDGSFRIQGLKKGSYSITANLESRGYGSANDIETGNSQVEIRLIPFGSISGRVIANNTKVPVTKFQLWANSADRKISGSPTRGKKFEDKDGKFTLDGISANNLIITISAEGFSSMKKKLPLNDSEAKTDLEFVLEPEAKIRGKVLEANSRTPIADAQLFSRQTNEGTFGYRVTDLTGMGSQAQSDAEGNFELGSLAPGKINIQVSHSDFAETKAGPFEVKAGETLEGIEVLVPIGGGIDGYFYDSHNQPIVGATIMIMGGMQTAGVYKNATTDQAGYFLVEKGLSPGRYQISGTINSAETTGDIEEAQVQLTQSMKTAHADVEEGKITRVMLGQKKEGGCKVTGRVLIGTQPAPSVYVTLSPKAGNPDVSYTVTDKDGKFTIENVVPGDQLFYVQQGGSATSFKANIPDKAEFFVELTLPNGSISGRVTDAKTGKPVSQLFITMTVDKPYQAGGWTEAGFGQTQTDDDGRYTIKFQKAGNYLVSVNAFDWNPMPQSYGRSVRRVTLQNNENLSGIDFAVRPGGTIEGHVTAGNGPVAGASVFFKNDKGELISAYTDCVTDPEGHFECRSLSEGSYTLFVKARGYAPSKIGPVSVHEGSTNTVQLNMSPGAEVTLKISAEGKALEGVQVQLLDNPFAGMMSMDEIEKMWMGGQQPGEYYLDHLGSGKYSFTATKEGYQTLSGNLDVGSQTQQIFEFQMSPKK